MLDKASCYRLEVKGSTTLHVGSTHGWILLDFTCCRFLIVNCPLMGLNNTFTGV